MTRSDKRLTDVLCWPQVGKLSARLERNAVIRADDVAIRDPAPSTSIEVDAIRVREPHVRANTNTVYQDVLTARQAMSDGNFMKSAATHPPKRTVQQALSRSVTSRMVTPTTPSQKRRKGRSSIIL